MAPMLVRRSTIDFTATMSALVEAIERRGLAVFARIDHATGASEAGLELEPEEVVLFGSPKSGTPLMQSDRRIGIELPLRVLLWRDGEDVLLGYRDPRELAEDFDVAQHVDILEQMASLLDALVTEAGGP
jgi:uncharacterized protein (DUF302 family)